MARKRLTQIAPFLLPLRKWQRKKCFYAKMRLDGCRYAKERRECRLPSLVFETSVPMVNEHSGFDNRYQINKVHNLKLAAKAIDNILIKPGETFSFWQLVKEADRYEKYKDGLNLINGKITASYGGGLCMLSDMLFWMFLHTPLTIAERHGHAVLSFPPTTDKLPCGVDAAVSEGWLDLKVRNETDNIFQIRISFDEKCMYGRIFSQDAVNTAYSVFNSSVSYNRQNGKVYQTAFVCRRETDENCGKEVERKLYRNQCRIAYELPEASLKEQNEKFEVRAAFPARKHFGTED